MGFQIDQSGKIEYTSKDTVLAISNGSSFSILIKAKEKRLLQKIFRTFFNKRRQYVYEVFSALVYILLFKTKPKDRVEIDKEYPGNEALIKLHILNFFQEDKLKKSIDLDFGLVGKSSPAHSLAYRTFKKEKHPSKIVSAEEVMGIIFPNKKDRVFQY